ncbi:hypothetical protein EJ03DRAFT_159037 [Teratosphaeria nubilosa]|uniref:Uncharacterized protein n=1 Tax=Teratosphaeria nubilosa TaxID=161662 RepID=A0A6G1L3R1_9PEZI|nr:hypothetical protein EJ03DRAFT_159037 [Teratosphaeria nubilosa]
MSIKIFLLVLGPVVALASPQGWYGYGSPPSPPLTTGPSSSSSLVSSSLAPNYTTTVTSTLDPTQCPIFISITPNASVITTTIFTNASDPTITVTSITAGVSNFTTTSFSNFTTTAVSTTTSILTEISVTTIASTATPSLTSYIVFQGFNAAGCPARAVNIGSPPNFQQILANNGDTGCHDLSSTANSYSILDVGPSISESCIVRMFPGTGCGSTSFEEINAQSTQNQCQDYTFQSFLLSCSGT